MNTLDQAAALIKARLRELEDESIRLRAALRSLGDGAGPAPGPPRTARTSKTPKKRTAKRAPRGRRRAQLLAAVKDQPGATAAELGSRIGISTNQAYALATNLHKNGELNKRGRGYHPAASSSPKSSPAKRKRSQKTASAKAHRKTPAAKARRKRSTT